MRTLPAAILLLACALAATAKASAGADRAPMRAIWVTRFDYRTAQDVEQILTNCAGAGFDTVMWQARGNATAFYDSPYEPWGEQLGGVDPGFDPLALACEVAKREGLELHAWVNVMPAWWGLEAPTDPKQLVNARPNWLWYDQHGKRQPYSERFYVSVNPCLPEVRSYLVLVFADLVKRYPVAGLHLDYVRFPNEFPGTPSPELDYPRDERTLALFKEATGHHPDKAPQEWDEWRAAQVTELVRRVGNAVRGARPGVLLSAAVTSVPERAKGYHQDVAGWIETGLFDVLFPMNYAGDLATFRERLPTWSDARRRGTKVVMGLRVDVEGQTAAARVRDSSTSFDGFCVFAYASLFDSSNVDLTDQDAAAKRERAKRREEWLPLLRTSGSPR